MKSICGEHGGEQSMDAKFALPGNEDPRDGDNAELKHRLRARRYLRDCIDKFGIEEIVAAIPRLTPMAQKCLWDLLKPELNRPQDHANLMRG